MAETASIPQLICELCRQFYELGWVSGTGGGISIRGDEGIYMAPSGVQKERIAPEDVYLLDASDLGQCRVLRAPAADGLRVSECQPLFYNAYRDRGAGAVIHSHSIWAVLAARLSVPHGGAGVFVTEGLEMQKGLRGKGCFERVEVPIIRNTPREAELTDSMAEVMRAYPDVDAVIVAGHGVYVWGETWVQAKTQAECYDYLFRAAVEAHRLGLPLQLPDEPTSPINIDSDDGPEDPPRGWRR
ncbi:methylthioribulose 1-phosphate dehydratase [Paraliomyxa miuraensis]|uniref:methylthioribulose 1-phosphate dehydratase n=1 Tax=Paraliomyxa miuraensis TaxID=376150 RepID=UPI0022598D5A|nr:methylthioribulose 1-phosphate dehydratase [Paraliomyxa miuraensis]MCX4244906.1 methylthioribulose 1-phosphate dehydratase [Paraliomyxa miuraensis]